MVTVEGVLEVLKGKGVVENDGVDVSLAGSGTLGNRLLNGGSSNHRKGGKASSNGSDHDHFGEEGMWMGGAKSSWREKGL